jgi:hypothetical protein
MYALTGKFIGIESLPRSAMRSQGFFWMERPPYMPEE